MAQYDVEDILKTFTNKISDSLAPSVDPSGIRNNIDIYERSVEFDNQPYNTASGETSYAVITPPVIQNVMKIGDQVINGTNLSSFSNLCMLLGGIQQMSVNTSKGLISIPEVGSKRKRNIPTKASYSGGLSKILTKHKDLKTAMYGWLFKSLGADINKVSDSSIIYQKAPGGVITDELGTHMITHMSGMESDQFNIPFGLLIIKQTANGRFIGADFGEMCTILSFGQSDSAGNVVVVQNANIHINRVVPFLDSTGRILNRLFTPGQKSYSKDTTPVDGYRPTDTSFII